jgi:hypothetical protein
MMNTLCNEFPPGVRNDHYGFFILNKKVLPACFFRIDTFLAKH